VKIAQFESDVDWLKRNPGKLFRLREKTPHDNRWRNCAIREPVMVAVYMTKIAERRTLSGVILSRPDSEDFLNPWLRITTATDDGYRTKSILNIRLKEYILAERNQDDDAPLVETELEKLDRTSEFLASLKDHPLRMLRNECGFLEIITKEMVPEFEVTGTVYDNLSFMSLYGNFNAHSDEDLRRLVEDVSMNIMCLEWATCGRPVFSPSKPLADKLMNENLVLDDSVPVAIPYRSMFVDVSHAVAFASSGRKVLFAGVQRYSTIEPGARVALCKAGDIITDFQRRGLSECTQKNIRTIILTDAGRMHIPAPPHYTEPRTWSEWRARALSFENTDLRRMHLLISGLCYTLATRTNNSIERVDSKRKHHADAVKIDRIRCYDVEDDDSYEISPTPIFRQVYGSDGQLDKETLILTKTMHREYVTSVWCGPGKKQLEYRVVPQGETRRWMRVDTLLAQSVAPPLDTNDASID